MESKFVGQLSALSHPQRLAVFRLLVRRYPDAVPAGEIARALGLKPNTASVYLSALREGTLITQQRRGTSLLYSADLPSAETLMKFLFDDCCRARPALCPELHVSRQGGTNRASDRRASVLFVCSGNSARSIFAEAILRAEAGDQFAAHSAGSRPSSEIHPYTMEILRAHRLDTSTLRAKSISEYQGEAFDFVFTVCDRAAHEDCPAWPGRPVTAHWGLPDPVKTTGSETARRLAFQQAFGAMANRIKAFASLPFGAMDRVSLQASVDDIGKTKEPA